MVMSYRVSCTATQTCVFADESLAAARSIALLEGAVMMAGPESSLVRRDTPPLKLLSRQNK
ncbi:MAG: hypothetical protein CBC82_02170 [Cellvibrionales bacterium TMED122]|nr:hypothetical protein [Halieaceae bacterium]OUV66735.1 MAG: hypothetical protein CBC82_02170 [Cellvibrionales bacterium TMED122]